MLLHIFLLINVLQFCGGIIAGLSLLTDSVMKLTMEGHEKECVECFLLPKRSLYIMRYSLFHLIIVSLLVSNICYEYICIYFSGVARYKYNHEILKAEESYFEGRHVPKSRRISIICRSEPDPEISKNSAVH